MLTISNLNVYQECDQQGILKNNIKVFEKGKLIGSKDFSSRTFYILKAKLKEFIKSLINSDQQEQKTLDYVYQQNPELNLNNQADQFFILDNLVISFSVYDNVDVTTTKEQVDTPLIAKTEYSKIIETIEAENQALKQEETERLRALHGCG
jgi:hypothetical protein